MEILQFVMCKKGMYVNSKVIFFFYFNKLPCTVLGKCITLHIGMPI